MSGSRIENSKDKENDRVSKRRAYIPPSVFTYQYNKRNYRKSYDEYLMKFIQDNISNENRQKDLFPFIEKQISNDVNRDNDKLVDILILYLHVYEYNLKNKKGTARSKEMMYDESALLTLQLLLDDIIDIDVDEFIEDILDESVEEGDDDDN
ncbi:hypothetical protein HANVADRAFT_54043 [Hanseniaspora valbyensis NRRL Y-1626]|uniref:Uncharacterized protein n=1 Tax=Hanseniaspora valbyensis NRRL Y-1626 TaxID=766949 RepID=A0A1B7T939_9ASCO|nr:hypothetical protein HANVADRAFT_54043 [Hanseniaspora valbyensis NRRL Y-1626]